MPLDSFFHSRSSDTLHLWNEVGGWGNLTCKFRLRKDATAGIWYREKEQERGGQRQTLWGLPSPSVWISTPSTTVAVNVHARLQLKRSVWGHVCGGGFIPLPLCTGQNNHGAHLSALITPKGIVCAYQALFCIWFRKRTCPWLCWEHRGVCVWERERENKGKKGKKESWRGNVADLLVTWRWSFLIVWEQKKLRQT